MMIQSHRYKIHWGFDILILHVEEVAGI